MVPLLLILIIAFVPLFGKAACHGTLNRRSLQVQGQELLQQFVVREVGIPSVCLEYGLIQPAMRISQPRRPLVVEVRERSRFFSFFAISSSRGSRRV
jgi:hypothetical protein